MSDNDKTLQVPGSSPGGGVASSSTAAVGDLPKAIGDFRIQERIGAGAMGEVYLATHRESGAEAAIKVIAPRLAMEDGFAKRFQREIDALTKLDHPNIAKAIAHGMHEGRPWLAMEFVRGPNLADVQRQQGALHEEAVLRLAIQVAKGLEHVQARAGLIHRDIKPANILIAAGEGKGKDDPEMVGHVAKIIDFGLAKSVGETQDQGLTMTGMVMGTPFYMSPEQIRGERDIDLRTDIYAIGATMYHLLTNALPYEGTSPGMVMTGHLTSKVPDPGDRVPSLHKSTRRLVMMAMAKDPRERFLNYQGFIAACEKALGELHERDHGTMRLLRKPLVLPGVQARPATLPKIDDDGDDPFAGPITERIVDKRAKQQAVAAAAAKAPPPGKAARVVRPAAPAAAPATTPATAALRQIRTETIRRTKAGVEAQRNATSVFAQAPKPIDQSAVFRAEPDAPPIWPLVMLVLSLAALVAFLALR